MAEPDTTNPTLTSATLPSVNVTGGGQAVTFSVGALDTGSGVDRVYLYFDHGWQGQTGLESVIAFSDSTDSFSDGSSTEPIYFDPSTSPGLYGLTSAMVYDKAGNWTQYAPSDLAALGIPTSFNVVSNAAADTTPPSLTSLSLSNVDVSGSGTNATFSAAASDSGSGVDRVVVYFDHNWAGQSGFSGVVTLSDSADSFLDGSSATQVYFEPATPAGTYNISSAIVYDKAGNFAQYSAGQLSSLGLVTSFTVISNTPADTTPPTLVSASMPTAHLSATASPIGFSVTAWDSGTGVDRIILYFDHSWSGPSGLQNSIQFTDTVDSFSDHISVGPVLFGLATPRARTRLPRQSLSITRGIPCNIPPRSSLRLASRQASRWCMAQPTMTSAGRV